jgi:hypothetical protein
MLDDQEYKSVLSVINTSLPLHQRLLPHLDEYERITGFRETNPNAVYHHRLSLYGSRCAACGKPCVPRRPSCVEAACSRDSLFPLNLAFVPVLG